jgi:hypothetical protein
MRPVISRTFPTNTKTFIGYTQHAVTCQTNNPSLPHLPVSAATLTTQINAVIALDVVPAQRTPATTKARKAAIATVQGSHRQNISYVQTQCDATSPEDAASIAAGSGYPINKPRSRTKAAYAATRGVNEGSVRLRIKSLGRGVQYCEEYSVDSGKTWTATPPSVATSMVISGLPVGQTAMFRFRTLIKGVYGDYSQVLSFLVH